MKSVKPLEEMQQETQEGWQIDLRVVFLVQNIAGNLFYKKKYSGRSEASVQNLRPEYEKTFIKKGVTSNSINQNVSENAPSTFVIISEVIYQAQMQN